MDEAHPPTQDRAGIWSRLTATPGCCALLPRAPQGSAADRHRQLPQNWGFIIEAVKRLDELFTSSSTVAKFTGLNPAASPTNGALRSRVLIAAGIPVPWLQAGPVGAPIVRENHPRFVQSSQNRVRDGEEAVLLCYSVLLPIR